MRRSTRGWTETLTKLGFKWAKKRPSKPRRKNRPCRQEQLEARQMLAADLISVEDNDSLATAQTAAFVVDTQYVIEGTVGDGSYISSDVDLYKVSLSAGQTISVDLDANYLDDGTHLSWLDSYLQMFDSSGNQVASSYYGQSKNDYYSYYDSYVSFTATISGDYFIGISGYGNDYYDPSTSGSGSSGSTGDYVLQLLATDPIPPDAHGDQISTAQAVTLTPGVATEISGEVGDGTYESEDVDFFAVTLAAGERLSIDIDANYLDDGTNLSDLNSYVRVFNASGSQQTTNNYGDSDNDYYYSTGSDSYLSFLAPSAGTYYIGISSYYNRYYNANTAGSGSTSSYSAASGEYLLQLLTDGPPTADAEGDDLSSASSVTLTQNVMTEINAEIGDGLYPSRDVDLFEITLQEGQALTVDIDANYLDTGGGWHSDLRSYLRLFDASGNEIAENNYGYSDNDYSGYNDSYLRFVAPSTGTYFIGVSSDYNTYYNATSAGSGSSSSSYGTFGEYRLQLLASEPLTADSAGEDVSSAESVTLTENVTTEINAAIGDGWYESADVDMYQVTLDAGDRLLVDIDADYLDDGTPHSNLNSYLRLFDASGNQINSNDNAASDNDYSSGSDSYHMLVAPSSGTYYIGVSSYYNRYYDPNEGGSGDTSTNSAAIGDYRLQLTDIGPPSPDSAGEDISSAQTVSLIEDVPVEFDAEIGDGLYYSADVDMYAVTMAQGQRLAIDIDASVLDDGTWNSSLNSYLRLFDASGNQIDYSDYGTSANDYYYSGSDGYLWFVAPSAGTFYIGVSSYNNRYYNATSEGSGSTSSSSSAEGEYKLQLLLSPALPPDAPGEDFTTAQSVTLTDDTPVELDGSIGDGTYGAADVDLYEVSLAAGQTIHIDVDAVKLDDGSSLSSLNSYIRVFDAAGNVLQTNNNAQSSNDYGYSNDAYLSFTAFNGGTYYIGVSSSYNTSYDPTAAGSGNNSTNSSATGDYKLQLLAEAPPTPDSAGEELSTAEPITLTPYVLAEIDAEIGDGAYFSADVDMYSVTLSEGQTVTFDLDAYWDDAGNTISSLNGYLRLFDSTGTLLQSDSSSHSDNDYSDYYWGYNYFNYQDAFLTFTAQTAGTYYLGVSSQYNTSYDPTATGTGQTSTYNAATGAYKLQVLTDGPAISVDDVSVGEDSSTMTFTVRLNPLSDETVTVDYTTVDGTALAGSDYTATSGTLTFAPGTATQTVIVTIADDGVVEDPESFTLQLSNISSNATLIDSEAIGTIADVAGDELNRALDVSLTPEVPVELDGTIGDGTYGTADIDLYAVTLAAGQTIHIDIDAVKLDDGSTLSSLNSYLRVFDASGNVLQTNNNAQSSNDDSYSSDAYISFTAFSGGTYYIGVSSSYNTNYDPTTVGSGNTSSSNAAIGDYKLQLLAETPPTPDSAGEEISTAEELELDPFVPLEIDAEIGDGAYFSADVDLYAVTLFAGQTVTFDLDAYWDDNGNTISSLNGYLRLFDSSGNLQQSDSSSHSDNDYSEYYWGYNYFNYQDAFLTFTASTAGTYYLGVSSQYNTSYHPTATGTGQTSTYNAATGAYKLQVLADGPAITVDDVSVGEDSSTMTFTVRLNPLSDETVTVDYTTADGTATAGSDYTSTSGTLTFSPGTATQTVTVAITDDGILEDPESFFLQLSNVSSNATLLDSEAIGTIADAAGDDLSRALDVSLTPETAIELNGSIGDGTHGTADVDLYEVTLSAGQTIHVDVDAIVLDDGSSLSSLNSYIRVFDASGVQQAYNNNAQSPDDDSYSADGYVSFTAFHGGTYYIGISNDDNRSYDPTTVNSGSTSTATDAIGAYQLELLAETPPTPDSAGEDISSAEVLTLDPFVSQEINAEIGDGAYFSADVDLYAVTLTAGQTVSFDLDAYWDDSGNTISSLNGYLRLFDSSGNLLDSDSSSHSDNDYSEYYWGYNYFNYQDAFLTFTAQTAGTYYLGVSSQYNTNYDPTTIGTGSTSTNNSATGAYKLQVLADGPAITVDDVSVGEDSGTMTFTVRLNPLSDETVTVDYTTVDGTATAGSDYTATSGTLTFAPGTATQTVTVTIADDGVAEASESFALQLSNISSNATLLDSEAIGTITPEPGEDLATASYATVAPGVTTELSGNIGDGDYGTADVDMYAVYLFEGQTISIDIDAQQLDDGSSLSGLESYLRLFNASGNQLTYNYESTSPDDYAFSDDAYLSYVATASGMYYIGISSEYNRYYNPATAGSGTNSSNADAIGDYTLQLSTTQRVLTIDDVEVGEYTDTIAFTVEIDYPSDQVIAVDYTTVDGTALSGSDYVATSGTITFPAGTTSQKILVTILDDGILEDPESFTLQLSNPTGVVLSDTEATATIGDAAGDNLNDALEIVLTEGVWSTINGDVGDGSYGASDVDLYQVTVDEFHKLVIDIDSRYDDTTGYVSGSTLNSYLRIFDAAGNEITYNDNAQSGNDYQNDWGYDSYLSLVTLSSGTYYIGVSSHYNTYYDPTQTDSGSNSTSTTAAGVYSLQLMDIGQVSPDAMGENLTTAQVVELTDNVPYEFTGEIGDGYYLTTDVDMVAVTLAMGQTLDVDIDANWLDDGTQGSDLNSYLRIFDSSGVQVMSNDSAASENDYSGSSDAHLSYVATAAGTYYIGISSSANRYYDPTTIGNQTIASSSSVVGSYTLQLEANTPPTPDAPGQTLTDALAVDLSDHQLHEFIGEIGDSEYVSADADLYQVSLFEGQTLTVDIDANWLDDGTQLSTLYSYLRIFDASGNQRQYNYSATSDNDYTGSNDSYIEFIAPEAGTYYIGVSSEYNRYYNPVTAENGTYTTNSSAVGQYKLQLHAKDRALTVDDVKIGEDSSTVTFTVVLNPTHSETVTVDYTTADGTALAGSDYTATSGTLTFAPGVSTQTVTVAITDDGVLEDPESFSLLLSNAINATIEDDEAIATIADAAGDDLTRALEVSLIENILVSVEGEIGDGTYGTADVDLYQVTLEAGQDLKIDIDAYREDDGNYLSSLNSYLRVFDASGNELATNQDAASDNDYSSSSYRDSYLLFTASAAGTYYIGVSSTYNQGYEVSTADSGSGSTSTTAVGRYNLQLTAKGPTLKVDDIVVDEDAGTATFTVTLHPADTETVTVEYTTVDGSALAGNDYVATSGTLSFAPGVTSQTVTVDILNDGLLEEPELFTLSLFNAVNATIGDSDADATIQSKEIVSHIQGNVFADGDEDGIWTVAAEQGLEDIEIHVIDMAGNILATTYTDAQGHFEFNLENWVRAPRIELVAPQGMAPTIGNAEGGIATQSNVSQFSHRSGLILDPLAIVDIGLTDDTDGDGISDVVEGIYSLNPSTVNEKDLDTDGDGLLDLEELHETGTNINDPDSDNDNLPDYLETQVGWNPNSYSSYSDYDSDWLPDLLEEALFDSNPEEDDADADGLPDYAELISFGSDPELGDTDNDGVDDLVEYILKLNPRSSDSDQDGVSDFDEEETQAVIDGDRDLDDSELDQKVRLSISIGDESGSDSEQYNFRVGNLVVPALFPGDTQTKAVVFDVDQTLEFSLEHVATNLSTPDYDWNAHINYLEGGGIIIQDEYHILGNHSQNDWPEAGGKTGTIYTHQVNLNGPDAGTALVANLDDDNENDTPDLLDAKTDLSDDDLVAITLDAFSHLPQDASGYFTVSTNGGAIKLWRDNNGTPEEVTSGVQLDYTQQHTFYAEPISAGQAVIEATFVLTDTSGKFSQFGELADQITLTVAPNGPTAAEDSTTDEDEDPCNCECSCSVGPPRNAPKPSSSVGDSKQASVDFTLSGYRPTGSTIAVEWQLAGGNSQIVHYSTDDLAQYGDVTVPVSHNFDVSGLDTGVYSYTATLSSDSFDPALQDFVFTGEMTVTKQDNTLGNGEIAGLGKMTPTASGVIVDLGSSGGKHYLANGDDTFSLEDDPYSLLVQNVDGSYTLTNRQDQTFEFDDDGLVLAVSEANGLTTTYSYTDGDGDGIADEIAEITDPLGETVSYTYSDGMLASVTDIAGRVTSYTYDNENRIETVTLPDPDDSGPLDAMVETYTYDSHGKVASISESNGQTTQYIRDSYGNLVQKIKPDGTSVSYESYGSRGLAAEGLGTTEAPAQLQSADDTWGTITNGEGVTSYYMLDKRGNVTRTKDELGNITIYERNGAGLVTKITHPDPDGVGPQESPVYEYTYDSRGNMLTETLPDGSVREWEYHSTWNEPIKYTDANGHITLYTYDSSHALLLSETKVIGQVDDAINLETDDLTTTFTYTPEPTLSTDAPQGLLASITEVDGILTEFEYDKYGNLTSTTYAVGTADEATTSATYDLSGNILSETDELGNTTTYTYDNVDRLTSISMPDPDGVGPLSATVTNYTYNALDLIASESVNGRTTTYTYDSSGRVETVTEVDPDNTGTLLAPETSFTYDSDGNVLTVTDPLGNVTSYGYTNGKLTSITEPDPDDAGPQTAPVTTMTYDEAGRLLTTTNPLGQVTSYAYDSLGREISVTLPDPDDAGPLESLVSTTEYDAFDRVISKTNFDGTIVSYTYDSEGNTLTETTALGTTTYEYDELNRILQVTTEDPDDTGSLVALVTTYAYTASGQIASVTTPKGTTSHIYDNRRRRTSTALPDPDGVGGESAPVSSTNYDKAGNVLTETDALANVTTYEYDGLNRVITITSPDPDGAGSLTSPVTEYAYDQFGQLVSMTDPNGGVTTYEYDDLGRKIKEIYADPDGAGPLASPEVTYVYDAAGQMTSMTDELGHVTSYEYDNLGRRIRVTLPDPDGAGSATAPETIYRYDAIGQLLSVTDPLNRTTTYTYDHMGRQKTVTLPDPDGIAPAGPLDAPVTTYVYNSNGQLASVTDAESQTVSYTYNMAGLMATMTDPRGTTTYTYDALGRQVSVTEPDPDDAGPLSAPSISYAYNNEGDMVSRTTLDGTTSYEYDDLGRLTKVTMPDPDGAGSEVSAWTVYTYDATGRKLTETDRLGHSTSYSYDNLSRLTKKTDAKGGETEYTYDANGNRLTLTDPEENTTTWTYDALNRMLTNTNVLSDTRTYEYDAAGNVVEYTDRNGRVTVYEYDDLQRRTAEKWMDGASVVRALSYSYDAASQLTSATDPEATYTFTYDNLGRNISTGHDLAALGFDVVIDEAYDALGRRTSLAAEIDGTDDLINTYSYDYLSRMTQVTQGSQSGGNVVAEKRVDFAYDAEDKNQFTSITRFADLAGTKLVASSTYAYDAADRIIAITHNDGSSSTLAGYTWGYDEGNRLTAFTVYGYSAEDATYSYDDTDQLTGADRSGTSDDESYTYDENGNRTNTGYSTGDNNQLLSDGTHNYTYDDEGNRLTKTNIFTGDYIEYTWDYRNRLTNITSKNSSDVITHEVDYTYDIFNRRIVKTIDADGAGADTATEEVYIYDGLREEHGAAGDHMLLRFDEADDMIDRFMYGQNVDQILASEGVMSTSTAGDVLWALTDHLETVRDVAEYDPDTETTTTVNHLAYDAFGNVTSETNSAVDFLFGFTGRERDGETDLQYNRARYYAVDVGRWISEDPLEFIAGDANLVRYVNNEPSHLLDPSGLAPPALSPIYVKAPNGIMLPILLPHGYGIVDEMTHLGNYNAIDFKRTQHSKHNKFTTTIGCKTYTRTDTTTWTEIVESVTKYKVSYRTSDMFNRLTRERERAVQERSQLMEVLRIIQEEGGIKSHQDVGQILPDLGDWIWPSFLPNPKDLLVGDLIKALEDLADRGIRLLDARISYIDGQFNNMHTKFVFDFDLVDEFEIKHGPQDLETTKGKWIETEKPLKIPCGS